MIWRNEFAAHPIVRNLMKYVNEDNPLKDLVSQINVEIRSFDNFKVEYVGESMIIFPNQNNYS